MTYTSLLFPVALVNSVQQETRAVGLKSREDILDIFGVEGQMMHSLSVVVNRPDIYKSTLP